MTDFLQACSDGLLTGALYALVGMGLALIFGVMRIVNFAHGAFLMVGMYITWLLFEKFNINPFVGFIPAGILLFGFGYVVYLLLIRPIRDRSDFMQILMTTGIGLILVDSAQLKFRADYHYTNIALKGRALHLGQISMNEASLVLFGIAVVLVMSLRGFVIRSRTRQDLRAIVKNREVAPL